MYFSFKYWKKILSYFRIKLKECIDFSPILNRIVNQIFNYLQKNTNAKKKKIFINSNVLKQI